MNIYDEVLKELKNFFNDEDWVWETVLPKTFLLIERAKKVEDLLGLYREKDTLEKNPYKNIDTKEIKPYYEWACELKTLEDKIKALEEEMK